MEQALPILLEALRDVIPMLRTQSDARIIKRIGKEKAQDAADDIDGYISYGVKREINRNQQLAITCQLLRCLSNYLEELQVPISLNKIVENIHNVPTATDKSFPGYAKSGILIAIIQPNLAFASNQ